VCDECGRHEVPVDPAYAHGDVEPCVGCEEGLARVELASVLAQTSALEAAPTERAPGRSRFPLREATANLLELALRAGCEVSP
jgi:hypothetical protein